jgi:hypothetical protein
MHEGWRGLYHPPTLEVASVRLLSVVLLPLEGLPTRPMRGSRGIVMLGGEVATPWSFHFHYNVLWSLR